MFNFIRKKVKDDRSVIDSVYNEYNGSHMLGASIKRKLPILFRKDGLNITADVITDTDRFMYNKSTLESAMSSIVDKKEFEVCVFLGRDIRNIDILFKEVH